MAGYRSGRGRGSNRSSGYGRRSGTRSRASRPVSARRGTRRRSAGAGTRTVRLVIEQAGPTPVVTGPEGYMVPDNSTPKRAKF